jgi:hypothetical protein
MADNQSPYAASRKPRLERPAAECVKETACFRRVFKAISARRLSCVAMRGGSVARAGFASGGWITPAECERMVDH